VSAVLCCSVPLKQWKCSFEESHQSQCVSDGLQAIAAVFAESQLFHEIHAYVTSQCDTSAVKSSGAVQVTRVKPDTEQLPLCDSDNDTNMSCVCAATTTQQHSTQLLTADIQLTTADSLSKCITDTNSAVDNDKSVTDSAALSNDVSVMNQTMTEVLNQGRSESQCRKTRNKSSASKIKKVCTRREQKRSTRALSDSDKKVDETSETGNTTSAGITHYSCHFSVICNHCRVVALEVSVLWLCIV